MPYKIEKSGSGYKVKHGDKAFSKKPQSKEMARKQLAAIEIHTHEFHHGGSSHKG